MIFEDAAFDRAISFSCLYPNLLKMFLEMMISKLEKFIPPVLKRNLPSLLRDKITGPISEVLEIEDIKLQHLVRKNIPEETI